MSQPSLRQRAARFTERPRFRHTVTGLILLNAVILGVETADSVMAAIGPALLALDTAILAVFVAELALKIYAQGPRFFKSGWNVFDFFVVGIALVPSTGGLSVLRALRVLRVLRLITVMPSIRKVVQALLAAIPGMGTVAVLLLLIFYVAAVIATNLFGDRFPHWFGTIGHSLYTLFQIMTLESWSMGIVRPVMEAYPYAWGFFVPFILITSFAVINLFVAIIVDSMAAVHKDEREADLAEFRASTQEIVNAEERAILTRLDRLGGEIEGLKDALRRRG